MIGRYVFHEPIIWSDELASILPVACNAGLCRGLAARRAYADDRLRRNGVASNASISRRAGDRAALAFLLLIIEPAYHFAAEEIYITTPALEISNIWRAAALPIGSG